MPHSGPHANSMTERLITRSLFIVFLVVLTFFLLNNVIYTWDLIGYVGSAISWAGGAPETIHNETYNLIEQGVPTSAYQQLVSTEYGGRMASHAGDFHSQLGMYAIKPLYVGLFVLLGFLGLSYIQAGILLSVVSGIAICVLAYIWLSRYTSEKTALALVFILLFCSRLVDVSRVITPDALSAFILFFSIYAILENRKLYHTGLVMLVVSILVRSNNIIFAGLVLSYLSFLPLVKKQRCIPEVGSLVAAVVLYLLVSFFYGHDWWRLFHHTFIGTIHNLDSFTTDFSLPLYIETVLRQNSLLFVSGFTVHSVIFQFLLLTVLWAIASHRGRRGMGTEHYLMAAMYLTVLAFSLLFPLIQTWDRFFIPFYFIIAILVVKNIPEIVPGHQQSGRP